MRNICNLFLLLVFSLAVKAEQVEMICRAQGIATDMTPLSIDLNKKYAIWGTEQWQVVSESEKYITIRTVGYSYSLGGSHWVVDRFSGDFVLTSVGLMSKIGPGNDAKLDGYVLRGICNKKKF